jgi:hypothetical protein
MEARQSRRPDASGRPVDDAISDNEHARVRDSSSVTITGRCDHDDIPLIAIACLRRKSNFTEIL